jgi:hypothetical protein
MMQNFAQLGNTILEVCIIHKIEIPSKYTKNFLECFTEHKNYHRLTLLQIRTNAMYIT